jgi:hypothetical protein
MKFRVLGKARVFFNKDNVLVEFLPPTQIIDMVHMLIFLCSE